MKTVSAAPALPAENKIVISTLTAQGFGSGFKVAL
jgi:hypothetical protein